MPSADGGFLISRHRFPSHLMSVEQYSALTDGIERKLDEADVVAEETTVRHSASEVFGRARARINEQKKI